MKKILLLIILMCISTIPLFGDDNINDFYWPSSEEFRSNENPSTDEIKALKNSNEAQAKKYFNLENQHNLITDSISKAIKSLMNSLIDIHHEIFGVDIEEGDDFLYTKFEFKERFSGYNAGNIFSFLVAIFLVISVIFYGIKLGTTSKLQVSEIMGFFIKVVAIFIIYIIMPYIPPMLIKLAFIFSEKITDSAPGSMTYSAALISPTTLETMLGLTGAGAAMILSFFSGEVGFSALLHAAAGVNLQPLSVAGLLLFAACFAGLFISFIVCIQFCIRCLDLFIANLALIFYLPATLFSGFSMSLKHVFQYYYKNFVEVVLGAIIILLVNKIDFLQTVADANWIVKISLFILKPTLLMILMHYTSKIASALPRGEVTDNNNDVVTAFNTAGKTLLGGTVLSTLTSFSSSLGQAHGLKKMIKNSQMNNDDQSNKNAQT